MIDPTAESRGGLSPDQFHRNVGQAWQAIFAGIGEFLRQAYQTAHVRQPHGWYSPARR